MICWLLVAVALAAPDDATLARQRQRVDEAAAAVSEARGEALRRSEIATRMAAYRREATTLAALEAQLPDDRQARVEAVAGLREALAAGRQDDDARAAVEAWLAPLSGRLALLEQALASASPALPAEVRAGLLRDVVEQAGAVALAATYDAARHEQMADRAELRARALRRPASPGQAADLAAEAQALRLDLVARQAELSEEAALALAATATGLVTAAVTVLEEHP